MAYSSYYYRTIRGPTKTLLYIQDIWKIVARCPLSFLQEIEEICLLEVRL